MNKNILIISAVILVAVGAAVYLMIRSNQTPPEAPNPVAGEPVSQEIISGIVTIKNFAFNPAALTINAGEGVSWKNNDDVEHQIASENFESKVLKNGDEFKYIFPVAGEYSYYCAIHPSMKGKITVQ